MNRREASKLETRNLILGAARKLLLENKGVQCTLRDIAREAGVSAASIVVHFKNKDALLDAALTEDIEQTTAKAVKTMPADGDLAEKLTHIWRAMFKFYDDKRALYRTLLRSTVFETDEKTPFLAMQTESFLDYLQEMIALEKAGGRMAPSVDENILAVSLFSIYFGTLILFYRNPAMTPEQARDQVFAMTQQVLSGLYIKE